MNTERKLGKPAFTILSDLLAFIVVVMPLKFYDFLKPPPTKYSICEFVILTQPT